jgi:AraC-like DNA-binding protein
LLFSAKDLSPPASREHGHVTRREIEVDGDARQPGRLPTSSGTITRLACERVRASGIALEPLLQQANLTPLQIMDASARIRVRDQIKFLDVAAVALDDDLFGFHLALEPDLRRIGLLYYVLASSETMLDAFRRAARYTALVNDGIVQSSIEGRYFGMSLRYVGVSRHLDRHQAEFWMTVLVRVSRQLSGLRLFPSRVRFAHHRTTRTAELAELFGDALEFGAPVDEAVFAATVAQLPVTTADPYLNRILLTFCDEALAARRGAGSSFRSSVENAVVPLLPHGKARADEVARRLGTSGRTFARRLSSEGLTFSELLESLRHDLARRYLAEGELSVSQIAWLLGYQEVGAFSRAFKRWSGETPREIRTRLSA